MILRISKKNRQKAIFILQIIAAVFCSPSLDAQITGDYQSNLATMSWNSTTGWQRYNGTSWVTTATPPTSIPSGNTVTILAGHTVTNNLNTVSNSGNITVNGTMLNNGTPLTNNASGVITVNGTFTNSASKTITNNGLITNNGTFTNTGILTNNLTFNINSNVSSGGTLNNNGSLTIAATKSLTNTGAVANNGTIDISGVLNQNNVFTNAANGVVNNSGTVTVLAAKTLTNNGIINNNLTFTCTGILVNNLTFNNNTGSSLTFSSASNTNSGTISNAGTWLLSAGTITTFTNTGTIINTGTITNSSTNTSAFVNNSPAVITNSGTISTGTVNYFKFNAGSTYRHNFSSAAAATGSIPNATWNAASTCEILACGNGSTLFNTSSFANVTLGNFIWNNSTQASDINLNGRLNIIAGNFTVQNTNGFKIILRTTTGNNTSVTGNVSIASGCTMVLTAGSGSSGTSNHSLTIGGNLEINGGTLNLTSNLVAGGNGNGTVNLSGHLFHSSGNISKTGITSGSISLKGSAAQTIETNGFTTGNAISLNIQQSGVSGKSSVASGKLFIINPGTTLNIYNNTSITDGEFAVIGTLQNSGNINVLSGAAIDLGSSVITDASSAGNFNLNDGATILTKHSQGIALSGASGSIQVTGTRTFSNGANYTYNGTSAQITGTGLPLTLTGKLKINNTGSLLTGGVTLTRACEIDERSSSSLILTNGRLITTTGSLLTLGDSSYVSPAGGSALSYVDGPLKKIGFYAGTEFIFPTGDSDKWSRIGFTSDSVSSSDEFIAEYYKADPWATIDTTLNRSVINRTLNNISRKEYWDLDLTAGTATGKVKLYWEDDAFSGIYAASASNLRVAHHYNPGTGLKWYGESAVAPFVVVTTSGTSGTIESFASLTSFSPLTIGSVNSINPLPIELLSFTGKNSEGINHLNWSTSSETNNDFFELQRSADGGSFEKIAEIDGNGNSTVRIDYTFDDIDPLDGTNYYRLKQIDFDGEHSYSGIVALENKLLNDVVITTFPNPASGNNVTLSGTGNISGLSIYNVLGEVIYETENLRSNEKLTIDILAKGIYTIRAITSDQKLISSKFIKN